MTPQPQSKECAQISECTAESTLPVERPPILDLTGKIRRVDPFYIKNGEFSDLWAGEWIEDTKQQRPSPLNNFGERQLIIMNFMMKQQGHAGSNLIGDWQRLTDLQKLNKSGLEWIKLKHKNVLDFLGVVYDMGYLPSIITPYCENGNILEFMKKAELDMPRTLPLIYGISSGLEYIHSQNIIHGDLRAANVLIDNNFNPVIADFGLTFVIDHGEFTTSKIAGPARWTAPEILDPPGDEENEPPYSKASDIFAFGMTMIEIITRKPPYSKIRNDSAVIFRIIKGERPEMPESIENLDYLKALVNATWEKEPQERPSALEIKQVLEKNNNADKVTVSGLGSYNPLRFVLFYIRQFFGDYDSGGAI